MFSTITNDYRKSINNNDLRRELLIDGAFMKVSTVIKILKMEDWMENPKADNPVLAQELSPYLPSTFYDQFGDNEPSGKELLLANIQNFENSIDLICEELGMQEPQGNVADSLIFLRQSEDILKGVKECLLEEENRLKEEITMENTTNFLHEADEMADER